MLLTYAQQLKVVIVLSLAFMLMFTSYASVEGIITKFYQDKDHKYFGPISLIIVYTFFALSTIYSSTLITTLGYRKIFILGALFYTLFESSALIIYFSNNQYILVLVVVTTSVLCGCAAGNIWVAQNSYIGLIASQQNVNGFYGLSQGIRSISSVTGFLLSVYIFKNYSGLEYFIIIAPISMLSIVLFCMLPQPQVKQDNKERYLNNSGLAKVKTYLELLFVQKNLDIYIFQTLNAVVAMLMGFFIYRINASLVTQHQLQTQQQFQNRTTFLLSFSLLWYGTGRCLTGFLVKYLRANVSNFLFCQLSAWLCLTSMLLSLMSYMTSSYLLLCICAFFFGISYTATRTSSSILIKQIFHNNLDMIGINYFVSSFAFVFGIFIIFVISKISIYLCFTIFIAFFAFVVHSTKKITEKFTPSLRLGTELASFESKN